MAEGASGSLELIGSEARGAARGQDDAERAADGDLEDRGAFPCGQIIWDGLTIRMAQRPHPKRGGSFFCFW
jgi:hypothetical protein